MARSAGSCHVPGCVLIAGSSKKTIRGIQTYQTMQDLPTEREYEGLTFLYSIFSDRISFVHLL